MNPEFRRRVFTPVILPLTVVGAIFAFAFSLSRLLLAVPEAVSTLTAIAVAAYVMMVAGLVAARPRIQSRTLGVGLGLGLVAVLAAGTLSAAEGIRPLHEEEDGAQATEGGGPPADPNTFVAVDIDYEAAPVSLPAGTSELTLDNQGAIEHNVTLTGPGYDAQVVLKAAGGSSLTEPVDLEPGTYEYHCSVPGHEAKMKGELTVS